MRNTINNNVVNNMTQVTQEGMENSMELPNIEITDEILDNIKEFRGRFFKELMQVSEESQDMIFVLFVGKGLATAGVEIEDPYEQLSLPNFAKVLGRVMEVNNMEELFRAMERLNRGLPQTITDGMG